MIFTSESGLVDASRNAEWDEWYLGHLTAMVAVPGITSAQRFRALGNARPPTLAMYSVNSPAVFESERYRRTRGMGPFVSVLDESLHRRNLFDGLDVAPDVTAAGVLLLADRDVAGPPQPGLVWLRAVGIDRSVPYRGIAVFPDMAAAEAAAARLGGATLYRSMTQRFSAAKAD